MFFLVGKESSRYPGFFEAPFLGHAADERCPVLLREDRGVIYMVMNHGHAFYCSTLEAGLGDPSWKNNPDGRRSWMGGHYRGGGTSPEVSFQRKAGY